MVGDHAWSHVDVPVQYNVDAIFTATPPRWLLDVLAGCFHLAHLERFMLHKKQGTVRFHAANKTTSAWLICPGFFCSYHSISRCRAANIAIGCFTGASCFPKRLIPALMASHLLYSLWGLGVLSHSPQPHLHDHVRDRLPVGKFGVRKLWSIVANAGS